MTITQGQLDHIAEATQTKADAFIADLCKQIDPNLKRNFRDEHFARVAQLTGLMRSVGIELACLRLAGLCPYGPNALIDLAVKALEHGFWARLSDWRLSKAEKQRLPRPPE